MVVSGLPIRNGKLHAGEIGTMSLDLLKQMDHFTIGHVRDEKLLLRIGVHSGRKMKNNIIIICSKKTQIK